MNWELWVLRLFHRAVRDKRVTTHLMLAARAFGAKGVYLDGQFDENLVKVIDEVNSRWGGDFKIIPVKNYASFMRNWRISGGEIIHLTMYGLPINEVIKDIRSSPRRKLIVVGGEKVPSIVYKLADWNVSVTNQPHSEISALAVFLHELFEGKELNLEFKDARYKIIPSPRDKKVIKLR